MFAQNRLDSGIKYGTLIVNETEPSKIARSLRNHVLNWLPKIKDAP